MATIEDLKEWINDDLGLRGSADKKIHDVTDEQMAKSPRHYPFYCVKIYTSTNEYTISANTGEEDGYLGCTASARKPRAGEDWTRGSDLPDGKLTSATWDRIIRGIVCYELEDISKSVSKTINIGNKSIDVKVDNDAMEELTERGIDVFGEIEKGIKDGIE